ncbi:MAG: sigma-70 family RNA polymerase sigma factor [Chloroflexota bacterium]
MSESLFDEAKLVRRLIAQDQSALSELYQQFSGLVYSIALRVVQNPSMAEEVTQDAFLKVWHQPSSWDPQRGKFVSWLLTITRYTAIDMLRKEQRRPVQDAVELDDLRIGKMSLTDDPVWQDGRILRSLLERLPQEQVQVIELAFFEGMSHSEMAEHLHLPLGTVKTRVRLGLQKLKALWAEASEN